MRKPYLRKLAELHKFKVWEVDGEYIRTKINEEFTNFGQHYRFSFIPKWELWIDKEYSPGEEHYFIDHLLTEWKLMSKGVSYNEAYDKAGLVEKRERAKSVSKKLKGSAELISKVHRSKIRLYSNKKVSVWIVDGRLVRNFLFIEFTEGGHDKVYSFIPSNEIWIDDDIGPRERKYILFHELHERNLMSKGWTYFAAHRSASTIELWCRHHPSKTKQKIKEELSKLR